MRSVPLALQLGQQRIRLAAEARLGPERALVAANALSLSRGAAALALLALSVAGTPVLAILVLAALMWLTDVLDGLVARDGWRRGAQPRSDGAALDPLMDDMAFVCGFVVLLNAHAVPVWFVAGLLASRVLFALIRTIGLVYREHFARAQPITKANGVALALGQLALLAHVGLPETFLGADRVALAVVLTMTATTTISVLWFAVHRHGHLLARLLQQR